MSTSAATPHLALPQERSSAIVTHEDPRAARYLARYLDVLDSSVSVLVHTQQLPEVTAELAALASHGFICSDLGSSYVEQVASIDARVSSRDYGYIAFSTSGTSGKAKVVLYSKLTLLACAQAISDRLGLTTDDYALSYVRPHLAYGLSIVHSHYLAGSKVEFRRSPTDPVEFQAAIGQTSCLRAVYILPIHAAQLTYGDVGRRDERPVDFRVAGAALPGAVAAKLAQQYPNATIANMYGQSELGPRITVWRGPLQEYSEGLVGQPLPGVSVQVRGRADDPSFIWVATPYRMLRYLGSVPAEARDATALSLQWIRTGDLGYLSDSGELVVTGRRSGQLNVAGELIPISAIESAVRSVASVATCRVASERNAVLGDLPVIWIVPISNTGDIDALTKAVRRRLSERLGRVAALARIHLATDDERHGKL